MPVRLSIESCICQADPVGQNYNPQYSEDCYDEPPCDFEEVALRYLDTEEEPDDTTERFSETVAAVYAEENGRVTVSYGNVNPQGGEYSLTQVTYRTDEPGVISIVRSGDTSSMYVIEEGKRHLCQLRSGPYALEVTFYGRKVVNTISDGEGEIFLDYSVEMGGSAGQRTRLKITLKREASYE